MDEEEIKMDNGVDTSHTHTHIHTHTHARARDRERERESMMITMSAGSEWSSELAGDRSTGFGF